MIQDWIDKLTAVWAFPVDSFRTVRSLRIVEGSDFEKISSDSELPVAMTMPLGVSPLYGAGGTRLSWSGETHFYVAPNIDNRAMPSMLKWYELILTAAAANVTLGGQVSSFYIPDEPEAIKLEALQFNDDSPPQWGFVVRWLVTEQAVLNVAAGV